MNNLIKLSYGLILIILIFLFPEIPSAQHRFTENFENDLSQWELVGEHSVVIKDSGDPEHDKVLVLQPGGHVFALVKKSEQWGAIRIEGEILFPRNEHNYFGLIYNYIKSSSRTDFGSLYIKGNGSYIRANPHRDGNVSRLLYEEFKTKLTEEDKIKIDNWHSFMAEIKGSICHLYVNNMSIPKITFSLYEGSHGSVGFKPRVTGGDVWLDNIRITSIEELKYNGPDIPTIDYESDSLITNWEFVGPFKSPIPEIERIQEPVTEIIISQESIAWNPFLTDRRGAVITGKVTEYIGENTVAYFRTVIPTTEQTKAILHITTIDELALWVNGKFYGFIYRDGYVSRDYNDWNAWYDFWKNPEHAGRRIQIELMKGDNQILLRTRNGQYASGGFFAKLETL